jgi:hypothetical protein
MFDFTISSPWTSWYSWVGVTPDIGTLAWAPLNGSEVHVWESQKSKSMFGNLLVLSFCSLSPAYGYLGRRQMHNILVTLIK